MLYKILLRLFDSTPQLDSQLPNHALRSENESENESQSAFISSKFHYSSQFASEMPRKLAR